MEDIMPYFGGGEDCTHCFAHIINLVAKSLMKMFDAPARARSNDNQGDDEPERDPDNEILVVNVDELLQELGDIEWEIPEQDDEDDIFDELAEMRELEHMQFESNT
ncbi:hypothetical protein BT96DRAFT_997433 [Gymnopus androsaceus JB14]|uniref:Uncharacterized protein n=1 Tax=Gymnopus androsaceus JB14 TaxID=1447944 RepID=A0A6A4HDH8_9AGAR|nr:hypothetical protein BT96DRAFT_997433 [Gymnopus androsaceus JB14]